MALLRILVWACRVASRPRRDIVLIHSKALLKYKFEHSGLLPYLRGKETERDRLETQRDRERERNR